MNYEIREIPITEIKQYDNNPRENLHAVEAIAAAIQEYGFWVPVIIDKDNNLIDGHLRLMAARKLNLEAIPAITVEKTEAEIRSARISINKMADEAGWDYELLLLEIEELQAEGYDISNIGMDEAFLERATAATQEALSNFNDTTDPDVIPINVAFDDDHERLKKIITDNKAEITEIYVKEMLCQNAEAK